MKRVSDEAKNNRQSNTMLDGELGWSGEQSKEPGVKHEAGHVRAPPPWNDIIELDISQGHVVDLTQEFNRIFVKTTFKSFKEFDELFSIFKEETGSVFRIKSSCSVAYENSRRKKHFIPPHFKFVTVRYCCVHYGQPKVVGQGIRTKQRYLPCGCECLLSLSYSRGALVISQANMLHNHDVNSEMAPFYAINRRVTNAELREVASIVEMTPNSRELQDFLQLHLQRPITLQDAKNVRARLRVLNIKKLSTKSQQTSVVPLSPCEREREEIGMDNIEVDDFQDVIGETVDRDQRSCWEEAALFLPKILHQQLEKEKQESDLDPHIRETDLGRLKTKLLRVMQNCDIRTFHERISFLERIIEGWEDGDAVHIQHTTEKDLKSKLQNTDIANMGISNNLKHSLINNHFGRFLTQSNSELAESNEKRYPVHGKVLEIRSEESFIVKYDSAHGRLFRGGRTSREIQGILVAEDLSSP